MGLSIAQGLIAAQGGTIGAENHPGGGAEFYIRIPADMRPATEAAGVQNHGAAP
jgi:signal transduction histidine kinase